MVKYVTKRTRYHWSLIFGLVIINNVLCVGISYDDWCCFFFVFMFFQNWSWCEIVDCCQPNLWSVQRVWGGNIKMEVHIFGLN